MTNAIGPRDMTRIAKALEDIGKDLKRIEKRLSQQTPTGSWISEIDTGTWMLKCSVCGCRVQEEKYRMAVGQSATKCPYCGAELGLGGYSYDEYADRPSQRGEDDAAQNGE